MNQIKIDLYRLEVGGVSPTGKSISVSVRVVHASGRGEAKLCGRASGDKIVVLGLLWGSFGPAPLPSGVFVPARLSADNLIKPV